MPKMVGTGRDPLGRYSEGLVFDLEDFDPAMVQDFVDKGWAKVLDPKDHPGRTVTQIANSVVRNDPLMDPAEQEIAAEIGDNAHAIVHLEDPSATQADYEAEAGWAKQKTVKRQLPADALGGLPGTGKGDSVTAGATPDDSHSGGARDAEPSLHAQAAAAAQEPKKK